MQVIAFLFTLESHEILFNFKGTDKKQISVKQKQCSNITTDLMAVLELVQCQQLSGLSATQFSVVQMFAMPRSITLN